MEEEIVLSVRDLAVSFRTETGVAQAVRGVSFDLKKGETLAIVGESGSGKSVTVKAIMGLLAANANIDRGEVFVGGRDALKCKEAELCRLRGSELAMVFQDPFSSLNPIMRVGRQIVEGMLLKNRLRRKEDKSVPRLSRAQAKQRAIALMEEVGIDDAARRFTQYPFEFSGGMRQRIVIAIALSLDSKILICDEPTTALDVTIQAQILDLIEGLKQERGLSVIFITHDLGVVARVADRVAVMYAGKIVEYGGVEEIFYEAKHPYTWALLASMPDLTTHGRLTAIEGSPPRPGEIVEGDAFARRSDYAMEVDFLFEPPFFKVSDTHYAATWLLHESAPKVRPPAVLQKRKKSRKKDGTGEE